MQEFGQAVLMVDCALLAVGVLSCGTRNECDPALALLTEYVEGTHPAHIKMGALLGLGLAYAGTNKEEVLEQLMPVVSDLDSPLDVTCIAALSLVSSSRSRSNSFFFNFLNLGFNLVQLLF